MRLGGDNVTFVTQVGFKVGDTYPTPTAGDPTNTLKFN